MLRLPASLRSWGTADFAATLKNELAAQAAELPLQQALTSTSAALDDDIEIMFITATETPEILQVKVGVFFSGIVAGCNCADDPSPIEPTPEYCELMLDIDRSTATATATLDEGLV